MALDAAAVIARYKAGMQGAGAKYTQGIQAVTDNPMAKAAAAVADGTWAARTAAAAPKLAAKLNAVTMESWRSAATTYGSSAYTASAAKAGANFGKVAAQVVQAGQAARQAAHSVSKSDPLGRVAAAMAATKAAWGRS